MANNLTSFIPNDIIIRELEQPVKDFNQVYAFPMEDEEGGFVVAFATYVKPTDDTEYTGYEFNNPIYEYDVMKDFQRLSFEKGIISGKDLWESFYAFYQKLGIDVVFDRDLIDKFLRIR